MAGIELSSSSLNNDANLQGYWKLESDGTDSSGNGYTLTASGSPSFVSAKFGNGVDLESTSSQYLSIADASCPNLEIAGSQTFSFWFKPESIALMNLIGKNGATNQHQIYLSSGGKVNSNFSGLSTAGLEHDTVLVAGNWYHIVFRYDGSTTALFVNNVKKSLAVTGTANDTNAPFYIGRDNSGTYGDGIFDDVAVFDRALTDAEINELYYDSPRNGNWSGKLQIQSDSSKVSGSSDLTDFPALISDSNLSAGVYAGVSLGSEVNNLTSLTPQAYYRFESGALTTDSSGNSYTLTNNNSVAESTGVFTGGADLGDQSGSAKSFSRADGLGMNLAGSWTYSFWVKVNVQPSTSTQFYLIDHRSTTGTARYVLIKYKDDSGTKNIEVNAGGTTKTVAKTLTTDQWYHYAVTSNGTTVSIYIDGTLFTTSTMGSTANAINKIVIGADTTTSGQLSKVQFDDMAMFTSTLTADQIKQIGMSGSDLRITTDSAGTTEIPFEVVSMNVSATTCEIWAKVPTLSYTANTSLYIWYGNSSALPYSATDTFGSQNVWTDYIFVKHQQSSNIDSTGNGHNGTDTAVTYQSDTLIGNSGEFNGSTSVTALSDSASLEPANFSIQAFVRPDAVSSTAGIFTHYFESGATRYGLRYYVESSALKLGVHDGSTSTYKYVTGSTTLTADTRYLFHATYNKSNAIVYVDGASDGNEAYTATINWTSCANPRIGSENYTGTNSAFFNGGIDEIRYKSTALAPDWITTEYNNQNSPSTFWTPISGRRIFVIS